MKTFNIPIFFIAIFVTFLFSSLAFAYPPFPIQKTGIIDAIDSQKQMITILLPNGKRTSLRVPKPSESFVKNDKFVFLKDVRSGEKVKFYYQDPFFGQDILTKAYIYQQHQ